MPSQPPDRPSKHVMREIVDPTLRRLANTPEKVMANRRLVAYVMLNHWTIKESEVGKFKVLGEPVCVVGLLRRMYGEPVGACGNKLLGMPGNYIALLTRMNDDSHPPSAIANRMLRAPIKIWVK